MFKKDYNQDRGGRFGGARGGSRGSNGRKEMIMHSAICSKCGKTCEVPFRPTGEKPVYCRDCFREMGGGPPREGGDRRAPRRDFDHRFEPKNDTRPQSRVEPYERKNENKNEAQNDDLKRQLESVNNKLDKLIVLAESVLKIKSVKEVDPVVKVKPIIRKSKKS